MRRMSRITAVLVLLFCTTGLLAQTDHLQPTRIAVIKADPASYLNEVVRIDGFVTRFVDSGSRSTSFFYLKDDWGSVIKVRTSKEAPLVGKRYSVAGPVGTDPRSNNLFISEETRVAVVDTLTSQPEPTSVQAKAPNDQATAQQPAVTGVVTKSSSLSLYLLIGGAVVVVLIAIALLMMRLRRDEMQTADYYSLSSITPNARVEPPPPPEQVIEGKTIKLHAPPPNTVKLLPGWFEVLEGDDVVKQIRFYKLGGERGAETTFGRATGRPYAHIQLKAPTVSSRQAKVSFDADKTVLTNFASAHSNPTRVNGRDLAMNETVPLSENDRVQMGEVSLLFHHAPTLTATGNA
jgi:FHA domain-containing protein